MEALKKVLQVLKKWNRVFCASMTCKANIKRDIFVIMIFGILSAFFIMGDRYVLEKKSQKEMVVQPSNIFVSAQNSEKLTEQDVYEEVVAIQQEVDTSQWKKYHNSWYGFDIAYPDLWKKPVGKNAPRGVQWEYRYQFRRPDVESEKVYVGFDVVIYDVSKVKELSNTEEFPKIKNEELKLDLKCANIEGHVIETGDYPAEEIYLPPQDDCFETTLFFSFIKERYIYNIIPIEKVGAQHDADPRIAIEQDFPEFFAVISTATLSDIVRPKVVTPPPKPKIVAPKPVSYKIDNVGRLVCAKKNDKPSKSEKTKKRHLDMECCLDPDETPNPWCYYPLDKYGKYLK